MNLTESCLSLRSMAPDQPSAIFETELPRMIRSLIRTHAKTLDRDDAIQECLKSAAYGIPRFRADRGSKFTNWPYTCMLNNFILVIRANKTAKRRGTIESYPLEWIYRSVPEDRSSDAKDILRSNLDGMPPRRRQKSRMQSDSELPTRKDRR